MKFGACLEEAHKGRWEEEKCMEEITKAQFKLCGIQVLKGPSG